LTNSAKRLIAPTAISGSSRRSAVLAPPCRRFSRLTRVERCFPLPHPYPVSLRPADPGCILPLMRTKILLVGCLTGFALFAQSSGGSIAGTVVDAVGVGIDKEVVQAKNSETGSIRKATTLKTGKYSLTDLPPGTYDISVNIPGFAPFEKKGIRVEAAKTAAVDIHLPDTTQLSTLGEDRLSIEGDAKLHTPLSGPTPRTADGKPDLTGVWWRPATVDPGKPEWLPFAQKIARERTENNRKDAPKGKCMPSPLLFLGPLYEFVQTKSILVEISDDDNPGFHQIYLDGRSHPKEPDPLWYGDSIGHWEGDTLVVDRVNFIDEVWLDGGNHPHTDKLHIIERYRRPDLGHLETEITVEDPGILAKPWTMKQVSDLAPKETVREFICEEGNKDIPHLVGK